MKIPLEYVGTIEHPEGFTAERIIAGSRISDSDRTAYTKEHEADGIHLETVENAVSGSLGFVDFLDCNRPGIPSALYLSQIGVEIGSRRDGVGAELLKRLEEIAKERGHSRIVLDVELNRAMAVLPFYERQGYEIGIATEECF